MNISTKIIARLHALSEAAMVLNSTLDLSEILSKNLFYILDTLNVDRGTLYLMDDLRKEIWSQVLTGDGMKEIRLPYGVGLAGAVAVSGEPIILEDAYQDSRFNPANDLKTGYTTKSMMVLPIRNTHQKQIGVLQLINKKTGNFSESDEEFASSLGSICAVAIENAMLFQENLQMAGLKKELSIAREIQLKLIPRSLPEITGYDLAFYYEACSEVGGDYLQVFPLEGNKNLIIIADVSGHGVPAALLVSSLHSAVESRLDDPGPLEKLAARLNGLVYNNSTSSTYITFFAAILDSATGQIDWVNAGHPSPMLIKNQEISLPMEASGPPLGMLKGMSYESASWTLEAGDTLIFFTDGITENLNKEDDLFGEERLGEMFLKHQEKSQESVISLLLAGINEFTDHQPADDDRTILVLKKC